MSKIRVHEYAKNNISSKDLMTKLKEMNIEGFESYDNVRRRSSK